MSDKYAALNIIRTNATKERRKIFSAATPDTQLFHIYTKKYHKNKYKNYLQKNMFRRQGTLIIPENNPFKRLHQFHHKN